ncbi:hypothetical protein ACP70R_025602 [Stipagrostis hirtigluma subsp. patula]
MAEVTLRRFELSDVDAMMAWASDPQVAAFCRWDPYESTEPLLAFLRDTVLPHPWFRAICLADGEGRRPAVVGAVSLSPTVERCRWELGYVLARAHWGKGVATAAVRRALAVAFAEVEGLERVEALVDVDNPASQRVAEKAGLRREGVLRRHYWHKGRARDMVMYSFISSDPIPERSMVHESHGQGTEMDQESPAQQEPLPTEAVTLRPFDLADVDAMMAWASDPVATAFMTWDAYTSRDALLSFMRDTVLPHPWFRAACLGGAGGEPVGAVSVTPTDDRCRAELGIVLARAHWGKGVATAALKRTVAAVFGDLEGVERVEALVDVDNAASQRALEKAGFQREAVLRSYCVIKGRLRDMVIFSFISSDPLVE